MATKTGPAARVKVTASASVSSTDEAATLSTDGVTLTIDSTSKRTWSRSSTRPDVFEGAGQVNSSQFTVNPVQGIVTFTTPHSTASAYTVDVDYLTSSFLGQTRGWSMDLDIDQEDHTVFSTTTSDPRWRTFKANLRGASVDLERLKVADSTSHTFMDRITADQDLMVELWTDSATNHKFEGFAKIEGDSFAVPLEGSVEESVSLMIDGNLYSSTV